MHNNSYIQPLGQGFVFVVLMAPYCNIYLILGEPDKSGVDCFCSDPECDAYK